MTCKNYLAKIHRKVSDIKRGATILQTVFLSGNFDKFQSRNRTRSEILLLLSPRKGGDQ